MNTTPFLIQKKSLPIWIGLVAVAILLTCIYSDYLEIHNKLHAVDFLNTNALLLATILAVTMSFTLLGLQFLAESYTPRALSWYLQDKIVYGFLILYVVLITLNLISSAIPIILPPIIFSKFAVIGTSFSLAYLVGFIYYISNKIQPERLMEETSQNISDGALEKIIQNKGSLYISDNIFRPFIILEQIMTKAINNNDIFSFVQGLGILFKIMDKYISKIQQDFQIDHDDRARYWNTFYATQFFFRAFSPMIAECIIRGREQFLLTYEMHMFDETIKIYGYRNEQIFREFCEKLDYVGQKIFNSEMRTASDLYLRRLSELMKLELETAKITKEVMPKDSLGFRSRNREDMMNRSLTTSFSIYRIDTLSKLGKIASQKKLDGLISSIMFDIDHLMPEVLKISDSITRRSLLYSFLQCIKQIQHESVDNGLRSRSLLIHTNYLEIQKMNADRDREAEMMADNFCTLILYSVKNGQYDEIRELGVAGRFLVDNHPKITIKILNALEKCLNILKSTADEESREMYLDETIKDIESVEKWNKKQDTAVTERVKQILKK